MPLLSVVVPFYNVERYVVACLESLGRQKDVDLEVVLVDDGSTDGTRALVEAWCERDPRFILLTQDNQGLGPARNTGARHARGDFLAFVDSDDVVPPHAYADLVGSLLSSGSDFAVGGAARFDALATVPSFLHAQAITGPGRRTSIRERPELVLDRMAWNKVYRRTFWDAGGFVFPAITLEDYPVSIAVHTAATAVDVLPRIAYYWRRRDGGELSITQRSAELLVVRDRCASAGLVLDLAEDLPEPAQRLLRRHLLEIDLSTVVDAAVRQPPSRRPEYLAAARDLAGRLDRADAVDSLAPFFRVQTKLVLDADGDALAALVAHADRYGREAPVVRTGGLRRRFVAELPGSERLPLATKVVEAPGIQLTLEDAAWSDDDRELGVRLLVDSDLRLGDSVEVRVAFVDAEGRRSEARPVLHRGPRALVGEDLAEIEARVDVADLVAGSDANGGFRQLVVDLVAPGVRRTLAVLGPCHGPGRYLASRPAPGRDGFELQPLRRAAEGFGVRVHQPWARVTGLTVVDGTLEITGVARAGAVPEEEPVLVVRAGQDTTLCPVRWDSDASEAPRFTVAVDAGALAVDPDHPDPVSVRTTYAVRLVLDGDERPLVLDPSVRAATVAVGTRMVTASRSTHGFLELAEEPLAPVLTEAGWTGPDRLRLVGHWPDGRRSDPTAVLRHFAHTGREAEIVVPVVVGDEGFAFEVDAAELVRAHESTVEGYAGRSPAPWHLVLSADGRVRPPLFDHTRAAEFAASRVIAGRRFSVAFVRNDAVRIAIEPAAAR